MTVTQPWLAHYDPNVPASLIYPEAPIHSLLEGADFLAVSLQQLRCAVRLERDAFGQPEFHPQERQRVLKNVARGLEERTKETQRRELRGESEARDAFAFAAQALEIGVIQREIPLELRLIGRGVVAAVAGGLLIAEEFDGHRRALQKSATISLLDVDRSFR